MALQLRYSAAAQRDLINIYLYSVGEWGQARAERYLLELNATFDLIAITPRVGRTRRGARPGTRKHNSGSHVVLYKPGRTAVLIIRVLHKRMLEV